jgi:hypothetical protein
MVIHVRDAAVALACASSDVALAVIAKREISRLFQQGGEYQRLFNASTDPLTLRRSVATIRRIDEGLDVMRSDAAGVELGVVVHGRLVISHIVLQRLGAAQLKDPGFDFSPRLEQEVSKIPAIVVALVGAFPGNSYPGNVFKNRTRCVGLLADAGLTIGLDGNGPD